VQISESSGRVAERRIAPRTKLVEIAYIGVGSENGGLVLDVSDGGLSFHAVTPVQPAERVKFLLSLRGHSRIEGTGEVVWTNQMGTVCGLKFTSLSAGALEFLNNWTNQSKMASEVRPEEKARTLAPMVPPPLIAPAREKVSPPPHVAIPNPQKGSAPAPASTETGMNSEHVYAIPPAADPYLSDPTSSTLWGGQLFLWIVFGFLGAAFLSSIYLYGVHVGRSDVGSVAQSAVNPITQTDSAALASAAPAPAAPASAPAPVPTAPLPRASDARLFPNNASPAPSAAKPVPNVATSAPSGTLVNASKTGRLLGSAEQPQGSVKYAAAAPSQQTKEDSDAGKSELTAALARLNGDNGTRDPSAAIKLLWAAIAKGNSAAEVTLADLYVYGDGVDQNCEQGRTLLIAASKSGNTQAKVKLDELNAGGCP